jgi:hypothetical protein
MVGHSLAGERLGRLEAAAGGGSGPLPADTGMMIGGRVQVRCKADCSLACAASPSASSPPSTMPVCSESESLCCVARPWLSGGLKTATPYGRRRQWPGPAGLGLPGLSPVADSDSRLRRQVRLLHSPAQRRRWHSTSRLAIRVPESEPAKPDRLRRDIAPAAGPALYKSPGLAPLKVFLISLRPKSKKRHIEKSLNLQINQFSVNRRECRKQQFTSIIYCWESR